LAVGSEVRQIRVHKIFRLHRGRRKVEVEEANYRKRVWFQQRVQHITRNHLKSVFLATLSDLPMKLEDETELSSGGKCSNLG